MRWREFISLLGGAAPMPWVGSIGLAAAVGRDRPRALIRRMSIENPPAPRIHGELLKLGFEIAPSSVAKYMA
jgi:hypothetical protein